MKITGVTLTLFGWDDIEVDRQGLVHAFDGPGLGAGIDFDLIARKKTGVLT